MKQYIYMLAIGAALIVGLSSPLAFAETTWTTAKVDNKEGTITVYSDNKTLSLPKECKNATWQTQAKWVLSSPAGSSVTVKEVWIRGIPSYDTSLDLAAIYYDKYEKDWAQFASYPARQTNWRKMYVYKYNEHTHVDEPIDFKWTVSKSGQYSILLDTRFWMNVPDPAPVYCRDLEYPHLLVRNP